ncbi:MAG: hypothetical protein QM800_02720 [Paludibacter sp.]
MKKLMPVICDVTSKETFHNHNNCVNTMKYADEPCLVGYVAAECPFKLTNNQDVSMRVSILDPGLVIYRIECY